MYFIDLSKISIVAVIPFTMLKNPQLNAFLSKNTGLFMLHNSTRAATMNLISIHEKCGNEVNICVGLTRHVTQLDRKFGMSVLVN